MKNKLLTIMLIIISAITLVGTTAFVVLMKFTGDENTEPTIDEVLESTVVLPEMTTKLKGKGYMLISFNIHTDSKKAKAELEKRDFQVRNIVIKEISEMTIDQFEGEQGISSLENILKDRINELMQEGTVVSVYATSFLPQ